MKNALKIRMWNPEGGEENGKENVCGAAAVYRKKCSD